MPVDGYYGVHRATRPTPGRGWMLLGMVVSVSATATSLALVATTRPAEHPHLPPPAVCPPPLQPAK